VGSGHPYPGLNLKFILAVGGEIKKTVLILNKFIQGALYRVFQILRLGVWLYFFE
jgi:hypothetical protein